MAATASIIIEVDDQGATQAFQRINAEAGKLGPTLQPVMRVSEQTFNNIEGGALKARESAALLGEESHGVEPSPGADGRPFRRFREDGPGEEIQRRWRDPGRGAGQGEDGRG